MEFTIKEVKSDVQLLNKFQDKIIKVDTDVQELNESQSKIIDIKSDENQSFACVTLEDKSDISQLLAYRLPENYVKLDKVKVIRDNTTIDKFVNYFNKFDRYSVWLNLFEGLLDELNFFDISDGFIKMFSKEQIINIAKSLTNIKDTVDYRIYNVLTRICFDPTTLPTEYLLHGVCYYGSCGESTFGECKSIKLAAKEKILNRNFLKSKVTNFQQLLALGH